MSPEEYSLAQHVDRRIDDLHRLIEAKVDPILEQLAKRDSLVERRELDGIIASLDSEHDKIRTLEERIDLIEEARSNESAAADAVTQALEKLDQRRDRRFTTGERVILGLVAVIGAVDVISRLA